MQWIYEPAKAVNEACQAAALKRQASLTKPPGSLGQLEELAVQLAALQCSNQPSAEAITIAIFAADHGIAEEGVSAFPQSVTVEMIRNFASGGAAISVLAEQLSAHFSVINMGTASATDDIEGVQQSAVAAGTANFSQQPAMNKAQLESALDIGKAQSEQAAERGSDIFIGGEMGIGNTSSATAIGAALLDFPVAQMVGPGTGVDAEGIAHKSRVIDSALKRHQAILTQPLEVLRCLGGFEIVGLVGAYIRSAQLGIPLLLDGFISTAAALCALRTNPSVQPWFLVSHQSAEPAHRLLIEALGCQPILNLGMRLGEASGAALAVPILRAACALHNNMACFSEAGVSDAL